MNRDHIVLVCTGNTCRSPMAAALLRHALAVEPSPLREMVVVSAGISASRGSPAAVLTHKALSKVGMTLDKHASQPLDQALVDRADIILGMTQQHVDLIEVLFDPLPPIVTTFCGFAGSETTDIGDPYGGNLEDYESVRDQMVEAMPGVLKSLRLRYLKE